MKWLIIAVFILAQRPTKPPESKGAAQSKVTQSAEQPDKADQSGGQSKPPISVTVNNSLPSPNSESTKEQTEENMRVQRRLTLYTGLLVIAGFVTAAFIWWQARETRRSVQAIRDGLPHQQQTAEAALLNAKAVIASERPWFVINITPTEKPGKFLLRAENVGRTPGELYEGHCALKQQSSKGFAVPEIINEPFAAPRQNLIIPEDGFDIRVLNPEAFVTSDMDEGIDPKLVFVYGRIRYWDMMNDRTKTQPYLTEWCIPYFHFPGEKRFMVGDIRYT